MLYMPIGASAPIRVQGVFVSDEEIDRITQYCSAQGTPMYNDAFIRLEGVEGNEDTAVMSASDDPLYDEIKDYVIDVQKASTSLLQRRFGIGYNRAARMIDVLEEKGIIGPAQGSKPRDVYIKKDKNGEEE
jgi:S-DNA-T family DNA segregation ATPase FtsK/SpoIIIE